MSEGNVTTILRAKVKLTNSIDQIETLCDLQTGANLTSNPNLILL